MKEYIIILLLVFISITLFYMWNNINKKIESNNSTISGQLFDIDKRLSQWEAE